MIKKIKQYRFLFEELVKRDFTKKYKRTILGILWSALAPLATLAIMAMVFTNFFGRNTPHYTIFLFCGNLTFSFFRESTSTGMSSLVDNSAIFSKVNVPKYMFLLSKNVTSIINYGINLVILFVFVAIDGLPFTWKFICLIFPITCLIVFNLGMGLILSALYIMFRDLRYLYDIFTTLLMYMSAIFYNPSVLSETMQSLIQYNPMYVYISYFRSIIIDSSIPSLKMHIIGFVYPVVVLLIGAVIYKKQNYKFLYYI